METKQLVKKAIELTTQNKFEEAEKLYKEILNRYPDNNTALYLLAHIYLKENKYDSAEKAFLQLYNKSPEEKYLAGIAVSLFYQQKKVQSIDVYIKLLKISKNVEYYINLLNIISNELTQGKMEYALCCYQYAEEAYKLYPRNKIIVLHLSIASLYTGKFDDSENLCYQSLNIDKTYADAWDFLGFILECKYQDEEKARECYKKSIRYGNKATGYYNLGVSYTKDNEFKKANQSFNKALIYLPDNITVIRDKAQNFLKQRKFRLGYKLQVLQTEMEYSTKLKNQWDGTPHKNSTLFIYPNMCYGDHIFFIRYIPFLLKKFKKVKMYVHPPLRQLLKKNYEPLGLEILDKPETEYDYSVALSCIPFYLNKDFKHIPFSEGYLKSATKGINSKKLKVGLCWQAGNVGIRTTIHRSVDFEYFIPLINNEKFDIYSFQVGGIKLPDHQYNLTNLGEKFKNFEDTAQYLNAMDVIVTVDTSVANLAGALGVKTFMMLPYYSEWRWFDNTERTEWYDSIKIFKQYEKNNWSEVIDRIIKELTILTEKC